MNAFHPRARKPTRLAQIELKQAADPHGLMNAGMTEGWQAEYAPP
jgi:hypothetical protein